MNVCAGVLLVFVCVERLMVVVKLTVVIVAYSTGLVIDTAGWIRGGGLFEGLSSLGLL